MYIIGDKLQSIPIPGHKQRINALLLRPTGKCAENIIRFEAFAFNNGNAHFFQQFLQERKLRAEIVRSFPSAGFIIGIFFMSKGFYRHIKRNKQVIRPHIDKFQQHRKEAVQCARRRTCFVGHVRKRVIRSVHQ